MVPEYEQESSMTRRVAPEDLRPGQYVMPLHRLHERYCEAWDSDQPKLRRWWWLPSERAQPLRVIDAAPPFVLVENAAGKPSVLDLRQMRLGALPDSFGSEAWRRLQEAQRRREPKPEDEASEPKPATE